MMKNKRFMGIILTVVMTVGMTCNAFAEPWHKSFQRENTREYVTENIKAKLKTVQKADLSAMKETRIDENAQMAKAAFLGKNQKLDSLVILNGDNAIADRQALVNVIAISGDFVKNDAGKFMIFGREMDQNALSNALIINGAQIESIVKREHTVMVNANNEAFNARRMVNSGGKLNIVDKNGEEHELMILSSRMIGCSYKGEADVQYMYEVHAEIDGNEYTFTIGTPSHDI